MLLRREFGHWKVVFLEHGQERVHVNRMDGGLEVRRAACNPLALVAGLGKTGIEVCGYAMHVRVEAVAFPMYVLADVDASRPQMGKHLL
jgi:hypothetical protein